MISIIIPVYNVEKYISQCLNSILYQSYLDFEVIIIDDGSKDKSGYICDSYAKKDSRITVVHQKNKGVSSARNLGIKLAKGKWITFVDSDDWIDKDFLESFNLSDECDLSVIGLRALRYPEMKLIEVRDFYEEKIILSKDFDKISKNNLLLYGTICCKAYNREILIKNNIRFKESISYHEDHVFFFQYLHHINKVSLHKNVCYNYRITNMGQSLSSKPHSWYNMNNSSNVMIKELLQLPFFSNLNIIYQRKMTTYCLYPKINACNNIFLSNLYNKKTTIESFNTITKEKDLIKQYYHPTGIIQRIQKRCIINGYLTTKLFYVIISLIKTIILKWK